MIINVKALVDFPRLAAQMAAATAPQAEAKVDDDLAKLNAYFEEKQVLANRQAGRGAACQCPQNAYLRTSNYSQALQPQGGLDVRFLAQRYQRGTQKVEKIMSEKHEYKSFPSGLLEAHAHMMQVISRLTKPENDDPFLGCLRCMTF